MPNFTGLWTADQQFQAVGGSTWPSFPGAPTSAVATATSGTAASVAFTAPSSTGYPASITGYIVTSSPGGLTGTGASSPISVTGLTTDTAYTFTVRAINATGTGPSSAASNSVTPVITYVEDVFSTYTYTGNGSTQTITNSINLSTNGGLVWTKSRVTGYSSSLIDTARGTKSDLRSSGTDAALSLSSDAGFSSFNESGYSIAGAFGGWGSVNVNGETHVSWTFRKQPKFFDIVTYTGNATNGRQISHSLGSAPGMIIIKRTDAIRSWVCFHRSLGTGGLLKLNQDIVAETNTALWYSTTPTSSYFAINNDLDVNASGGTYVAYLFAHDAGGFGTSGNDNIISCGTFTGNTTVTLGYEPQWILVKKSSGVGDWYLHDNMRGWPVSGDAAYLLANSTAAEGQTSQIYPNATGFSTLIGSGDYIYIAIRRGPMKVPTDASTVFARSAYFGNGSTQTLSGIPGKPTDLFLVSAPFFGVTSNRNYFDRMRGRYLALGSDNDGGDGTDSNSVTGFDVQSGVAVGTAGAVNLNSRYFMSYHFRRAPGFFDVANYTGSGSSPQVLTHNLTVTPEMMIVKFRDGSTNWYVYHSSLGNTKALYLGGTATGTPTTSAVFWNNTTPTSTQFTVGSFPSGVGKYVAYLFATLAGVSKVGTYTGTGTTKQVDCGFTAGASFLLIKRTDSTGDWFVYDSTRGIISGDDPYYFINNTTAQVTNTDYIDPYSAGFELSSTAPAALNANGGTYIFLAIA